ncbi:MAG: hypothetical protein GXO83_11205 [Chlorobi bacterium]|nr:hypothetical protein [Chlorobiota bacterium]
MRQFRRIFLFTAGWLVTLTIVAQTTFNSPFSILGLGDLAGNQFARNSAMGGLSVSTRHPWFIDFANPASYTVRDTLSLVFDFGLNARYNVFENTTASDNTMDFNFHHFAFSFPIAKNVGMAFGILPFTQTNYILNEKIVEGDAGYDPNLGGLAYLFRGEGGTNQFFVGAGMKFFDHLSLGINVKYIFGEIKRIHSLTYLDNPNAFNTKIEDRILVSDFTFDAGLQYHKKWGKENTLTLGLTAGNNKNIRFSEERLEFGVLASSNGSVYNDTISFNRLYNEKMFIPYYLGGGLSINLGQKVRAGLEYYQQDWSRSQIPFSHDSLTTSRVIRFGTEFIPNPRELRKYWKLVQYRAGIHYGNSYVLVNQQPVTDFGISFGVGLPILGGNIQGFRKWSIFSITFGTGWRGSVDKNFMREQYNFVNFGLSFNDVWFIKRKYL